MQGTASLVCRIFIAATVSGPMPILASDQPAQAEVLRARASAYPGDDPEVAGFNLRFDLRLTNKSEKVFHLPNPTIGEAPTTQFVVIGVESKGPDGAWIAVMEGTWYGPNEITHQACGSLLPGRVADIRGMASRVVLPKKSFDDLGREPVLRLKLWLFCREPDGTVPIKLLTTNAFKLRLPVQP